jgi:orotidine-5'-phosphate decarboxylase
LALKPRFVTVHAAGGPAMLRAAAQAAAAAGADRPRLLAVTVLTSLDDADLKAVGQRGPVHDQVVRLSRLAHDCGIDGAICSPHEIAPLRAALGRDFVLMVPGIRPDWAGANDQKRVMTPREAMEAGADHLVIGRPITASPDPKAALQRVLDELNWPPKSKSAA